MKQNDLDASVFYLSIFSGVLLRFLLGTDEMTVKELIFTTIWAVAAQTLLLYGWMKAFEAKPLREEQKTSMETRYFAIARVAAFGIFAVAALVLLVALWWLYGRQFSIVGPGSVFIALLFCMLPCHEAALGRIAKILVFCGGVLLALYVLGAASQFRWQNLSFTSPDFAKTPAQLIWLFPLCPEYLASPLARVPAKRKLLWLPMLAGLLQLLLYAFRELVFGAGAGLEAMETVRAWGLGGFSRLDPAVGFFLVSALLMRLRFLVYLMKRSLPNRQSGRRAAYSAPHTKRDNAEKTLLWLLAAAAILLTGTVGRSSAGSRIRAVVLDRENGVWHTALLYQQAERAADSAEAQSTLKLAEGKGSTLSMAFVLAEAQLPEMPAYRLCSTVFLGTGSGKPEAEAYLALLAEQEKGRTAAQMFQLTGSVRELLEKTDEDAAYPEQLLAQSERKKALAPRLYSAADECVVLPFAAGDTAQAKDVQYRAMLLAENQKTVLSENAAQAYWLMSGKKGIRRFSVGGGFAEVESSLLLPAVELANARTGTDRPPQPLRCEIGARLITSENTDAESVRVQIETTCREFLNDALENGHDPLSLRAAFKLDRGDAAVSSEAPLPIQAADARLYLIANQTR